MGKQLSFWPSSVEVSIIVWLRRVCVCFPYFKPKYKQTKQKLKVLFHIVQAKVKFTGQFICSEIRPYYMERSFQI